MLRHHAFSNDWFKLNATFDLAGNLIQPGLPDRSFAVNHDIATPMVRIGDDVAATDLFPDAWQSVAGSPSGQPHRTRWPARNRCVTRDP